MNLNSLVYISVATVLAHGTLWVATFAKRNVAQGRAIVVRLVVHEVAWIFILLCGTPDSQLLPSSRLYPRANFL